VALIDHQPQMLFGTSNFDHQNANPRLLPVCPSSDQNDPNRPSNRCFERNQFPIICN
jgi:hypothetical protein